MDAPTPPEHPPDRPGRVRAAFTRVWRAQLKIFGVATAALLVVLLLIQLVPYGRDHDNPAVRLEPAWDSPRTRDLTVRACFDCHSNESEWPWYSNIAPVSWYVQSHVEDGRRKLNFSEWDLRQQDADEAVETIREGSMPPWYYTIPGTGRGFSAAELDELARGLDATLTASGYPQEGGEGRDDGEEDED